jgi:hypothetical protein
VSPDRKCTIAVQAYGEGKDEVFAALSAVMRLPIDGAPQLVEVTVRAPECGEIAIDAASRIDFQLLAKALNGVITAAVQHSDTRGSAQESGKSATQKKTSKSTEGGATHERPYRRMPDAADVKAVFHRNDSVGEVARHFSVPRYTAQAWIDRLRRIGDLQQTKPIA